jgi:hypothetical protein
MSFESDLDKAMAESVIDPTRVALCPQLFDKDNEFKPEVLDYVKRIVNKVDKIVPVVGHVLIKGSILSYQWLPTTDFDVLVEIDEDITDEQYEVIKEDVWEKINSKDFKIPDTKHPVEVFVHRGQYNLDNADGIYDLYGGWLKGPYSIEADTDKYMNEFTKAVEELDLESGELIRNIIDYKTLSGLPSDTVRHLKAMVRQKLEEIEHNIRILAVKKNVIKQKRRDLFDRDMSPREIKEYGSKNLLPDNVVLKMLERYHYIDIIGQLEDLLDDNKITDAEIEEIGEIFNFQDLGE